MQNILLENPTKFDQILMKIAQKYHGTKDPGWRLNLWPCEDWRLKRENPLNKFVRHASNPFSIKGTKYSLSHSQKSHTVSGSNGRRVNFGIQDGGQTERKAFSRLLSALKWSQFGRFHSKSLGKKVRPLNSSGKSFKLQVK